MTVIHEEIDRLVKTIVALASPLEIILFGSSARDINGQCNDIDLMIVMPDGTHRRKTAQYIYRSITGIKAPFDIIVSTPSDLKKYKDSPGLIYKTIIDEGRTIYAA